MASVTHRRSDSAVTRKGRTATARPLANFINLDSAAFTATAFRVQRLSDRFGITADRAALIASLAFGEAAHG